MYDFSSSSNSRPHEYKIQINEKAGMCLHKFYLINFILKWLKNNKTPFSHSQVELF